MRWLRWIRIGLILVMLSPFFASPAAAATSTNVDFRVMFLPWRNEYRVDYWNLPAGTVQLHLHFESPTYDKTYGPEGLTGIMMLTCTGVYEMHFKDSSGTTLASIVDIETPLILNGTCASYSDGGARDDLTVQATPDGNGGYDLTWNNVGQSYEIWRDGSMVDQLAAPGAAGLPPGSYTIVAKDGAGNIIGESDILLPIPGGGGSCAVCDKLAELLACPGWAQIINDLDGIIPDPPDWDEVADKIGAATVAHLANLLGPVPDPPTQGEINELMPLPDLDTDIEGLDELMPILPAEFDNPIDFDLDDGPEIEIVDESQPFEIFDPLHDVPYDDPGVIVLPGDPRNDAGGIGGPEEWDSPHPMPTPQPSNTQPPLEPVPLPDVPPSGIPIPDFKGGGVIPIPGGN